MNSRALAIKQESDDEYSKQNVITRVGGMDAGKTLYLDGVCPIPPGVTPAGGEVVEAVVNPWL